MTSMNVFRKSTVTLRDALPHWLTGRAIGGSSILRKPVQRKRQVVGVHRLHRLHVANHWAKPSPRLCKVVLWLRGSTWLWLEGEMLHPGEIQNYDRPHPETIDDSSPDGAGSYGSCG